MDKAHATPSVAAGRPRILVADDNADMRQYIRDLLDEHWAVDAVADGTAALAAAREHKPDLVLADVMMPGLDGFDLLAELRADPRRTAFLLCSSLPEPARKRHSRASLRAPTTISSSPSRPVTC